MAMHFHSSALADQSFSLTSKGKTFRVAEWGKGATTPSIAAFAGRMNSFTDLASVEGLKVLARADGTTGLDLLERSEGGTYPAKLKNGQAVTIEIVPRAQKRGHASGIHYWLPTDAQGRFKSEPGQRHRKVYVSGAPSALTRAAIAASAGVSESTVTGPWLNARPQYGGTPDQAVDNAVFELILDDLAGGGKQSRSDWYLFERGYSYSFSRPQYWRGEDELHPVVFGAWGTGAHPQTSGFSWTGLAPRYMLIRDLEFDIFNPRFGYGIILENCRVSGTSESQLRDLVMATWKEVVLCDVAKSQPGSGRTYWDGSNDRISGVFGSFAYNFMMSGCVVDLCGWAEGYNFNRSAEFPMAPSDRNHGVYITFNSKDIHIRDSLISRNSSCGFQIRCGGQYERNLFVENNIQAAIHSATNLGPVNQFSNFVDSVVFGAGYKKVVSYQGGINWGYDVTGYQTSMIGNIVSHLANPDDPVEIAERSHADRPEWSGSRPYTSETARLLFNNTQVYNWLYNSDGSRRNENVEGLNDTILNQTTIQRYGDTQLGLTNATSAAVIEHIKAAPSIEAAVKSAIGWSKSRFGRPIPSRAAPENLVFIPDPRTDGFRWDNRRNWTTSTLPGVNAADTVDLAGNVVRFGTLTADIASLTFNGGNLDVTSGLLKMGTIIDEAKISVGYSGQLSVGGSTQPLRIDATCGRTVMTGTVTQLDMAADAKAQVLLGPNVTVPVGKKLALGGPRVRVGWDGTGTRTLTVAGTLEFTAGIVATINDALYKHRTVHPGSPLLASDSGLTAMLSDFEEWSKSTSRLHLYRLSALPQVGEKLTVGSVDEVHDSADYPILSIVNVTGILSRSLPQLSVFRSGMIGDGMIDPTATASLILAAGSIVVITGRDLLLPGIYDLTGPGVTVTNNGATLPTGVTLSDGRLVLTIA